MKIAIDARFYGLEHGGIGRYVINLVDGLSRLDQENSYVVLLPKQKMAEVKLPSNWKKIPVDFKHYTFAEQFYLPKLLSSISPDLVHFPHFNVPVFYTGAFVVTIHDLLMQKYRGVEATTLPPLLYYPKQLAAKVVFATALSRSKKIIVPSSSVKKELLDYSELDSSKIVAIHEGVGDGFVGGKSFEGVKKYVSSAPYFLYVGNAYPHKNLNRVIEAILELRRGGSSAKLVLVSAKSVFSERLKRVIGELGADDAVTLLNFVTDTDLFQLYKGSIGFIFASLSEGFGLPGLEAMKAQTLVLASDIPVFREVYGDNAIYFNPYNLSEITNAMKTVLELSQEERLGRISKSSDFVKKYSWDKMAEETVKVYEDSLSL